MVYSRFGTTDEKGRLQPPKSEPRPQKRPGARRSGSRLSFAASVLVAIAASLWAWKVASPESFSRTWDGIVHYFADLRGSVSVKSDQFRPRPGATGAVKVTSSAPKQFSKPKEGNSK